jgi:hypothetical protein
MVPLAVSGLPIVATAVLGAIALFFVLLRRDARDEAEEEEDPGPGA